MKTDILTTEVIDKTAVVTLGSPKKLYFDMAMGDVLTEELQAFAGDPGVRVVVITGGTPGYFNRHFDIPALIDIAEQIRASGRQWPDNASYHGGFFDKAMAICETMPKPVIAAISGTALAGAFEFTLACDIRIAEDGDYLIGLPETELCPAQAERKGFRARLAWRLRFGTFLWAILSVLARPKPGVLSTKRSRVKPSIARWRLPGICRNIHRNRRLTLSVSCAAPTKRLWRTGWLSNEIFS